MHDRAFDVPSVQQTERPTAPGDRRNHAARERLVERVLAEFREMPCLHITAEQADRLFGLRPDVRGRIFGRLVKEGRLRLGADGRYAAA